MKPDFDKLPWHDAKLLNIFIDRSDPGHIDEVSLDIVWPDGNESRVKFLKCYRFEVNMNFNIIVMESIGNAVLSYDSPQIDEVKLKWSKAGTNLDDLKLFYIETNSTSSTIQIIARDYFIENRSDDSLPDTPKSVLNTDVTLKYYKLTDLTLNSYELAGGTLSLRFVPIVFQLNMPKPVHIIDINLTTPTDDVKKNIEIIKSNFIVDRISISDTKVLLWDEYTNETVCFHGKASVRYDEYSASDFADEIQLQRARAKKLTSDQYNLKNRIDQATRHIDQAIDRLEKKISLHAIRATEYKRQIQLIKQVRKILND